MSELDHPLRFNVGFIVAETYGYSRVFPVEVKRLHIEPDIFLQNVSGHIHITRTAEGLLVQCLLSAEREEECGRCLDPFMLVIRVDFSELYAFPGHTISDTDMILPPTGYLDIGPVVRDYVLLENPIKAVCKPDCKGLCPTCGENLNYTTCNHKDEPDDSRLAVLRSLLDKKN
ncbi:MAG: DUF177 domain-containing protein [Chloroflexota bacterium]|jgi:uncharacterized protein